MKKQRAEKKLELNRETLKNLVSGAPEGGWVRPEFGITPWGCTIDTY